MENEFRDSATLYNRWIEGGVPRWQRTLLTGLALVDCRGEAMRHSGAASSSARRIGPVSVGELTLLIPCGVRAGYLTPLAWRTAAERTGNWTLEPGDLVTPGDCPLEPGENTTVLMESCERVMVISKVTELGAGGELVHWEVSAR